MKKTILLLIGTLFLSPAVFTIDLANNITKALNTNDHRPFNGIVLVAKGDKIIFEKAQGTYGYPILSSQFIRPVVKVRFGSLC